MYSTKFLSATPAVQHKVKGVLKVWNQVRQLACKLYQPLNNLQDRQSELLLTDSDREWLKAIDHAFKGKVRNA